MAKFKSGLISTGPAGTIESVIPEDGDVIDHSLASKKPPKGAKTFKALRAPLNLVTPQGVQINFVRGFCTTANKSVIEYLETKVGTLCELC